MGSYENVADLREQVQLHLTSAVSALLERDRNQPTPAKTEPEILTAPTPDVRVRVHTVMIVPSDRGREEYIRVEVQNHSPIPVFITGLSVGLTNGKGLYSQRDALTQEYQSRRRLESGESYAFFLNGRRVTEGSEAR